MVLLARPLIELRRHCRDPFITGFSIRSTAYAPDPCQMAGEMIVCAHQ